MDPQDKTNTTDTTATAKQHTDFKPGETNARASRTGTEQTGAAAGAGTQQDANQAGQQDANQAGQQGGSQRVRMTRDEGSHRAGEVITVPAEEARRLLDSGAATAA